MTKPPQFHRAGHSLYITDDGEYRACRPNGPWIIETKTGLEVARANTYNEVLRILAEWWETNGYDKREKEFGRW